MVRKIASVVAALACALVVGCAPPAPPRSARALIVAANDEGLPLKNPLALDARIRSRVEEVVGNAGSELARVHRLRDFLSEQGEVPFKYAAISYDAEQAFHERRGDCMSYAMLFVALARSLDLAAYFVHVSEVRNYFEHGGSFFVSSHVAVGFGTGPQAIVIDLSAEKKDWQLAMYERIDDAQAAALFFNNLAVDRMLTGDMPKAERLFSFLHAHAPEVLELTNNYGVLLNREHRYGEALDVLLAGLRAHPSYGPLYTNAVLAARNAGKPDLADTISANGEARANGDPFFLFARGMNSLGREDFSAATAELGRAADVKPDSAVILAWLTRARLENGDRRGARDAFDRALRLDPKARIVTELRAEYPELR